MENRNALLRGYLAEANLTSFERNCLSLQFPEPLVFHAKTLNQPENQKIINKELSSFFNHHLSYKIIIDATESLTPFPNERETEKSLDSEDGPRGRQFVGKVLNIFGGEIVSIKPKSGVSRS